MKPIITTHDLTKKFGDFVAVDRINLEIMKGEVFGFLGPNGAGKSTTIRMVTTLTSPSEGTAVVDGFDVRTQADEVRRRIGLVAEKLILYPRLTAVENLMFFGELYGMNRAELIPRIDEVLRMVHLENFKDMPTGGYSSGMRQRLNIIRGLLHNPDILFLDEPTALLDPQSVRFVRDLIKELNASGKTIILTTHIMEEADELSNTVGIIDHGKMVAVDETAFLKSQHKCDTLEEVFLELTGRTLRDSASSRVPMGRRPMGRI
ncbi:ABC transporter ATP-binding protein [Candidatus Bathyarchaeota archaeon]|jgi:ABC-2 type transport system ATP-binding protein|nr:ABC transporter ATP-binding protein [Candidatus Bathyarchaeota archaeon]